MNKLFLAGCVILKDDCILLLNRKKTNWYELPGGKIDPQESAEEAAKRELKEEMSCDVQIIKQLGKKDFEENGYVMSYTWFLAKIKEEQVPKIGEPEKFDHFKYIPIKTLANYNLSPNMKNLVNELSGGNIALD